MGCTSSGGEPDSDTLYPTVMEDANGNLITLQYDVGSGSGVVNTSARITQINDPRNANCPTFSFAYNTDTPFKHLKCITNSVGTSESYTLTYLSNQQLYEPFTGAAFGPPKSLLQSAGVNGLGIA